MSVTCPLCASKEVKKRKNRIFDTYFFRCNDCDLYFSSPEVETQSIENYYKSRNKKESGVYKIPKRIYLETSLWDANRRHNQLANMINSEIEKNSSDIEKNKKVLEIGFGKMPYTLICLHNMGHSCTGVDPSFTQWGKIKDKNIKIYKEVFANVKFNEKFDVVILSHVLEHVADPIHFLLQINSIMAENGLLFIEIPNSKNYYQIDYDFHRNDEHLFWYNSKNLVSLLNKCGFANMKTATYDCIDIQLDWIINKLLLNKKHKIYTGHHSIKITNKFVRSWLVFISERLFKYIYIKMIKGNLSFYIQNEKDEGLWILSFSKKYNGE